MNKIYFTSDLHAFHKNIVKYTDRDRIIGLNKDDPNMKIHNDYIVNAWNSVVDKDDTVYLLGDLCFINEALAREFVESLNGHKILIYGNHDETMKSLEPLFDETHDILTVNFKKSKYDFLQENFIVTMCHYPMLTWNRRSHGSCHIHGHCHGNIDDLNRESGELRADVGFDSELGLAHLVSLEELYGHFKGISGGLSFREYIKNKINKENCAY